MSAANQFSPHPQWIDSLHGYVKPYWDELLQGEWAEGVASTRLSISEMRGWILQNLSVHSCVSEIPCRGVDQGGGR